MLYTCENCKYIFEFAGPTINQCPDCGKMKVRTATEEEIKEFESRILEEDDE